MQPLLRTSLAIRKTVLESVPIISSIDDNRNFHFRINPSEYFFLNPRSLVVDIELSIVKANGEKLSGPHADELTERMMAMILQAKSDYVQYKEQYRSWRSRQQQQADSSSSSSSRQKRAIPRTPSKTPRGRGRGSQTASRTNRPQQQQEEEEQEQQPPVENDAETSGTRSAAGDTTRTSLLQTSDGGNPVQPPSRQVPAARAGTAGGWRQTQIDKLFIDAEPQPPIPPNGITDDMITGDAGNVEFKNCLLSNCFSSVQIHVKVVCVCVCAGEQSCRKRQWSSTPECSISKR